MVGGDVNAHTMAKSWTSGGLEGEERKKTPEWNKEVSLKKKKERL